MSKKKVVLYLIVAAALVALVLVARQRIHFQWSVFGRQIRDVSWTHIAIALVAIYLNYFIRGVRWAFFVRPVKRVPVFSLVGCQAIGFAAVGLFGRIADLVRPYMIAKRTSLTISSQVAVYTVERMFDLGSMALIFSLVLLFAPDRATLPHHEALQRSAIGGLAITVFMAVFAFTVHFAGLAVATMAERTCGLISPKIGHGVATKIREFREGLNTITGIKDFAIASTLSMTMWILVTVSYLEVTHAFVASPELSMMTLAHVVVLQASSLAGSILQLPIIGWFTNIGVVEAAMQTLFHIPAEPALACSAMILVVISMAIIPVGLIWARLDHVSLKKLSEESEHIAEEELTASEA